VRQAKAQLRRRVQRQRIIGPMAIIATLILFDAALWLSRHPQVMISVAGIAATAVIGFVYVKMHRAQHRIIAPYCRRPAMDFRRLSPTQFEHAIADLCRRDGCTRVSVVGGAGDLAADVLATTPDGRRILIQAKRYQRGNNVGSPEVQKVGGTYSVVHRAQLAAVVTTSGYTKAARSYAATAGIRLFDEQGLAGWASRTGPAPWH
jgi:restriction system protein